MRRLGTQFGVREKTGYTQLGVVSCLHPVPSDEANLSPATADRGSVPLRGDTKMNLFL